MWLVSLGLFALMLYLAIRLVASASAWMSGVRYRPYRLLAARYRGRFERRGFSDPPTVSFSHNGANVRVGLAPQVGGKPQPPRTRVVVKFLRGLPLRLELAPASRPPPPQLPKGTRPVRVDDLEFDRGYSVQANDVGMARALLAPGVRWSIANLARLGPPGGILVSINPQRLLVQVDRNLGTSADALASAVYDALIIHHGLCQAVAEQLSEGIAIVASGAAQVEDSGPPICKVCGEPIIEPGVLCGTCQTPHHRDCWEFVGACSVYGCNGRRPVPA
jgi:hypothetical protein